MVRWEAGDGVGGGLVETFEGRRTDLDLDCPVEVEGHCVAAPPIDDDRTAFFGFASIGEEFPVGPFGHLEVTAMAAGGELEVACAPNPVVRGEEITCEATRGSSPAPSVRRWFFRGGGHTVEAERTEPTWQGTMAVSGTVSVVAAPEAEPDTARTEVTVEERVWVESAPEVTVTSCAGPRRGCPLRYPPVYGQDLGQTALQAPAPIPSLLERRARRIQTGPNEGWSFLDGSSPPIQFTEHRVFLNRILTEPDHKFWKRRPNCDVDAVRDSVRKHELVHVDHFERHLPATNVNQIAEDAFRFGSIQQLERHEIADRSRAISDTLAFLTDSAHTARYPSDPCNMRLLP